MIILSNIGNYSWGFQNNNKKNWKYYEKNSKNQFPNSGTEFENAKNQFENAKT